MGNLWGTLARVKGVKGGGVFHAHDTKRHGITRYPMPITQNDIALQGIPCPLHKTTLHYKVSHAHYTKRHRITRDPMPITQNDIELQGIPCPLHKTTPNYKVFRYRNSPGCHRNIIGGHFAATLMAVENPVSFRVTGMEYLVIQCRFMQCAWNTL